MLKDIASIVQICFYVVGATIAILTYRSAKKGLLNTVNTEYQKRVMDHLNELSETLFEEFHSGTRNKQKNHYFLIYDDFFSKDMRSILEDMKEQFKKHGNPETFEYKGPMLPGEYDTILQLSRQVKSDPFIPDHITEHVVNYLATRKAAILKVTTTIINEYEEILTKEKYSDLDKLPQEIYRGYKKSLEREGFGSSQVIKEVEKIRMLIKEYLRSFNPLP